MQDQCGRRTGSLEARVAAGGALGVLYVGAAWVGEALGAIGALTVWYPPAGVALGATVLLGWWAIPFVAVGELVAGVVVFHVDEAFTPLQLVVNAAGYAVVWGIAGLLVRRSADQDLRRVTQRVLLGLVVAMAVAPFTAAVWGVLMQRWAGLDERGFMEAVGLWWTGDAVGATSVAPSVLVVAYALAAWRRGGDYRMLPMAHPLAVGSELLSPIIVAVLVFLFGESEVRFPYLIFIPIVLVALHLGIEGVALATLGVTPVVTVLVEHMRPEVLDKAELQALLLVGIGTGLVVGAVTSERRRLGRRHRELSAVVERTPDLVSIVDERGALTYLNPAARRLVGLHEGEGLQGLRDVDLAARGVAADLSEQARLTALRQGAWAGEVRLRGADGHELVGLQTAVAQPALADERGERRVASITRDVTEERRLQAEVTRGALYDALTDLPNRTLLMERVEHAMRRGEGCAVLVVSIDRFSVIAEGAGLRRADAVVCAVADRLAALVGELDTLARLSTDSFAVLLEGVADDLEALAVGDRLLAGVDVSVDVGDRAVPVSVSVGVARPDDSLADTEDLLRAAQVAAHRAAELPAPRAVRYGGPVSEAARRRLETEGELRDALQEERWWLAYQPIVDLATGAIISCEALLRWTGADGQVVRPYEFVVLAEETGLIVPLGEAVLRRACLDTVGWSAGGARLPVSVNVSPRQLVEPGFAQGVTDVLRSTGIDPSLVTVELTESCFAGDLRVARPQLDALEGTGVAIAMDDFGTGYSSLALLGGLPISSIKLDKSFIDDLASSRRCRELVRGVITMAHALGVAVVAEGVEAREQADLLRDLDCDRAQGFLFARPIPPDELVDLLHPPQRLLP